MLNLGLKSFVIRAKMPHFILFNLSRGCFQGFLTGFYHSKKYCILLNVARLLFCKSYTIHYNVQDLQKMVVFLTVYKLTQHQPTFFFLGIVISFFIYEIDNNMFIIISHQGNYNFLCRIDFIPRWLIMDVLLKFFFWIIMDHYSQDAHQMMITSNQILGGISKW